LAAFLRATLSLRAPISARPRRRSLRISGVVWKYSQIDDIGPGEQVRYSESKKIEP
jgi:hypothetical protein